MATKTLILGGARHVHTALDKHMNIYEWRNTTRTECREKFIEDPDLMFGLVEEVLLGVQAAHPKFFFSHFSAESPLHRDWLDSIHHHLWCKD